MSGQRLHELTSDIETLDRAPPGLRDCVHEFGLSVVMAFVHCGITKPATIRHLVHVVHMGAREPGNKKNAGYSGHRGLDRLDLMLMSYGTVPHARAIIGALRDCSLVPVPIDPTPRMVAASITALAGHPVVTYERKHQLRLRAAIRAGGRECWPFLYGESGK